MPRWARVTISILLAVGLAGCASGSLEQRATPLMPGEPYEGMLGPGSEVFTFTLDEPASIVLESYIPLGRMASVAPNGQLLDDEGDVVARDWHSGEGRNFRIETELPAGTWYLRVNDGLGCNSEWNCRNIDRDYGVTLTIDDTL
ncbi:hypothetical protein [Aidingimonas halophila]|uniref:Pre-peptidase C-terminal domain-containing protein n=1 Tax=Aidingimonas halophila TaxID=574349 RepID=A0A1H3FJQ5_9GAMM|nr:hypothetical protein [Aidingimonas halophila]GHC37850.1 hypothetical protein GCM10008094_33970 [Aidingimonas halophila]SDX90374.1 hypothetical protein SAMN05443545_10831 [Aidingimonas halophila]